jgi:Spy/CpxP family protein refolding chaperone
MKKLFAVLLAALFAGVTFSAIAADAAVPVAPADKPAMEKKQHKSKKHHKKAAKTEAAPSTK